MKRALALVLLGFGLVLPAGCDSSQSGDSVDDTQVDQAPGDPGDEPEDIESS
jgi:hypothetical protein